MCIRDRCRGYYVDTVGKDTKKIKEYIANQLREDQLGEQLTLNDFDPFTGCLLYTSVLNWRRTSTIISLAVLPTDCIVKAENKNFRFL